MLLAVLSLTVCGVGDTLAMESSDDKCRPPVLVRREKRSSSTPRSPPSADTSRSPSPSPPSDRLQHVYPDVIIIERGTATAGGMSRLNDVDKLSSRRNDDDDDTEKTLTAGDRLHQCHVSDDASLKDYTFMYKKDNDDDDSGKADKKQVDASDYDAHSDISSVSSSIVDYVRRSLTEVGVESRDSEHPPPLPVKTTTLRHAAPLQCEFSDVIASTWEPTHMTWEEVSVSHFVL